MNLYGLIGFPLSHSFSKKYFTEKFANANINAEYELFPIESISMFSKLIAENQNIKGLNVTIPYKEEVFQYLDEIDVAAREIGAVNTIKFVKNASETRLIGYNTDCFGFEKSFTDFCNLKSGNALIIGTGGGSKAVFYVLKKLGFKVQFVSPFVNGENILDYSDLTEKFMKSISVIVNATPVGMFPNIENSPGIPYHYLNSQHFLFDLVYNPMETLFLKKGKEQGAYGKNGLEMLHLQAEKAWEIWNS
jgi:shikimate dehydrogenase